jgi:hypothetical protein
MLFLLNSKGVPSVARWVHLDLRAAPGFGTGARVSIVDGRLRLRHRAVTLRLANANGFAVPARAYLRLMGRAARNARRATAKALLPAGGTKSVVIRLGKRRASLVRGAGHLHAAIRLVVRDPRGTLRTVKRTIDVVAQHP